MLLNKKPIIKILSAVMSVVGAAMLLPCAVSIYYGDSKSLLSFLVCAVPMLTAGLIVVRLLPKEDNSVLRMRDGFFIVGVAWISMSAIGALPFVISGCIPNFCDAFFETASGFTTTGSTILPEPAVLPKAMLFWRSFTHWIGGMGVLVLTVALLPMLGIGGQRIMRAETTGPTMGKITASLSGTAKRLYTIYTAMTILEVLLLVSTGIGWFDSLVNTFGSVGTGGLTTTSASIGYYQDVRVEMIIAFFMMFAGINFGLYYHLFTGDFKTFFKDVELRAYLFIIGGSTAFIALMLTVTRFYGNMFESLRYAFFQVSSIITTTGFVTADFDLWPVPCKVVLLMLMLIGGCAGSTGGGMKVIRIVMLAKFTKRGVSKRLHPRALSPLKIGGRTVSKSTEDGVMGFTVLYIGIILIGSLIVGLSGADSLTSITSVIACISNIGPGFNLVGPSRSFAFFPGIIKLFLSMIMIIGRLELFTIILLFTPQFWNKNR